MTFSAVIFRSREASPSVSSGSRMNMEMRFCVNGSSRIRHSISGL